MSHHPDAITEFRGPHAFLSNFHPSPIATKDGSLVAPTVEHAYQACKFRDLSVQRQILEAGTPGRAKRLGRKFPLREDWERIKVRTMRRLLVLKFRQPELRHQLLATGGRLLIEGNRWGDRFWGMEFTGEDELVGDNVLGLLLMDIRDDLITDHIVRDAHIREVVRQG